MNHLARRLTVACTVVAMLALAAAGPALADYVGYAITKKGEFPLPESVDDVDAKHLIDVKWGGYTGPKSRVAVLQVDNTSNVGSFTVTGPGGQVFSATHADYTQQVPVNGIEAMITDSMNRSGRFRMVEREFVGDVLAEQDLGASGRVAQPSAAKIGKVLGAQYLVQAVITSYEPNFKKRKGGLGGITKGLLGGAKMGRSKSMVGMNFRLIDAETSEILFTKQVDVIVTSTEFGFGGAGWGSGGALGGFLSGYSKTPIGQAVMAGVNIGVFELIKQIGNAAPEGSVIKADGGEIYVNLGQDVVEVGDTLTAVSMGEELIDPETGISLGGEETVLGTLRVSKVQEKYCVASPAGGEIAVKRGDKVVSTKAAAPLQFAPSWQGPGGDK